MTEHRFIIRKLVMATSAQEAIEKESSVPVQDVVLDEQQPEQTEDDLIGFEMPERAESD